MLAAPRGLRQMLRLFKTKGLVKEPYFRFRLSGNFSRESCIMYSVFNCVPQLLFCVMISTVFGSQGDLSVIRI